MTEAPDPVQMTCFCFVFPRLLALVFPLFPLGRNDTDESSRAMHFTITYSQHFGKVKGFCINHHQGSKKVL